MAEVGRPGESSQRSADASRPALPEPEPGLAWEQVERGRYRPRRIRGSFPGRELG